MNEKKPLNLKPTTPLSSRKPKPVSTPVIDTAEIYKQNDLSPEKHVRSDLWEKMNLYDLWNQRTLMNNKIVYLQSMGRQDIALQVVRGMAALEVMIEEKTKDEDITIFLGRT